MIRRSLTLLLVLAVGFVAVAPSQDAAAASRRRTGGRYSLPDSPEVRCGSGALQDKRLVMPFSGWLTVDLVFDGDWILSLRDDHARVAYSDHQWNTDEEREVIEYYARKGEALTIRVCKRSGEGGAEISWNLVDKPAWLAPVPKNPRSYEEQLRYRSPAPGFGEYYAACHVGFEIGCTATDLIAPWARYVTVDVEDQAGTDVWVALYQFKGSTGYEDEWFCTRSGKPMPIKPQADWIGVVVNSGPACGAGAAAVATAGKATFTFSSHP